MCTALTFNSEHHYFGRNLDLDYTLNEQIVITPRNYSFDFKMLPSLKSHYAIIGVAKIDSNYPLYYDATNEVGLSVAGLNFPESAVYFKSANKKENIAPFEIIPYVLGKYKNVDEVVEFFKRANIADVAYSDKYPLTPLHWIIADKNRAITIESVKDGLMIYENSVGVLTNNPDFNMQIFNLNNYAHISQTNPDFSFSESLPFFPYSRGLGGLGLPGDFSSMSRFVRAVFAKLSSYKEYDEANSIGQFFHILSYVEQVLGCIKTEKGNEFTIYSSCCDTDKGIYYYSTYQNRRICAVDMHKENLDSDSLIPYDLIKDQMVFYQN